MASCRSGWAAPPAKRVTVPVRVRARSPTSAVRCGVHTTPSRAGFSSGVAREECRIVQHVTRRLSNQRTATPRQRFAWRVSPRSGENLGLGEGRSRPVCPRLTRPRPPGLRVVCMLDIAQGPCNLGWSKSSTVMNPGGGRGSMSPGWPSPTPTRYRRALADRRRKATTMPPTELAATVPITGIATGAMLAIAGPLARAIQSVAPMAVNATSTSAPIRAFSVLLAAPMSRCGAPLVTVVTWFRSSCSSVHAWDLQWARPF